MSRNKIPAATDLAILQELAANVPYKNIANKYKVSLAYISKLKTGKKTPYVHVLNPTLIKDEYFEIYYNDLVESLGYLGSKDLIVNKHEIIEYLEVQMKKSIIKAKMYQEILNKIKEN